MNDGFPDSELLELELGRGPSPALPRSGAFVSAWFFKPDETNCNPATKDDDEFEFENVVDDLKDGKRRAAIAASDRLLSPDNSLFGLKAIGCADEAGVGVNAKSSFIIGVIVNADFGGAGIVNGVCVLEEDGYGLNKASIIASVVAEGKGDGA